MRRAGLTIAIVLGTASITRAADPWTDLEPLYLDLHKNPELSLQETKTAAKLAGRLRALGFAVTEQVGGNGVVGILGNGKGPVVMLRTELDALPVEEKTGLPYASEVAGVMHACGHDVHMTAWTGAAAALAADRKSWSGTLMMVAQPAEETGEGAVAMLRDGLFTRFPRPKAAIALHINDRLPAGVVAIKPGPMMPSADSVEITVFGRGGHGAQPQLTIDPIVIASKIVLGLQVLVSRENDPQEPVVVTVGSIHGGTRPNIIPDEVKLQLTVRAFQPKVRDRLLAGVERVAHAEAAAAGALKPPDVTVSSVALATWSDDALAALAEPALVRAMGRERVVVAKPVMPAEDFSRYAEAGVPTLLMWIGGVDPGALAEAAESGTTLPGTHSPLFAPVPRATILGGIEAHVAAAKAVFASGR